jgi:hypothetical protein
MGKKQENKKTTLNKISAYSLFVLGLIILYFALSSFGEAIDLGMSLFFPIINILFSIALFFLGIYVLRIEKWAIILAGVYGLVGIITGLWVYGLFSGTFLGILMDLINVLLIINWGVQWKNVK